MELEEPPASPPDASLANVSAIPGLNNHSQDVLKKFNWAIKKVANEHGTNNTSSLTEEELIQLIRSWEPQRDIVCLYVRWSRQLKRNFNLDSIATLLCLSRQCGYTPLAFLRKVKTLTISKSKKGAYGLTFTFDTPDRQEIQQERLNKEFIGLSVTLALLQEQVTDMPSILGKTKMRQSGPRNAHPIGIHVEGDDKQQASIMTQPNSEFHTQSSLLNRIWLSIKHRWLALYMVEHLFREDNQPSWSFQQALIFSFQMMAPCGPIRFEFLAPLVGYCLKFPSQDSINTKRTRLREIWLDPSSFLSFGKTCLSQFSNEAQTRMMQACFTDMGAEITTTKHPISYNRDCPFARRWKMLRSYVFHFWLESTSNSSRKVFITDAITPGNGRKSKRKRNNDNNHTQPMATGTSQPSNPILARARQSKKPTPLKPTPLSQQPSINGLLSITASRKPTNSNATVVFNNPPSESGNAVAATPNQTDNDLISTFDNINWTSLRLISAEEMESLVQSYLIIHRQDGVDVVSELSPLEVYSADKLHDLRHCRLSGPIPFFPKSSVGPVYLHVRPDADQFMDIHSKTFHVVRERSDNFLEHSSLLPSMNQILALCRAIVRHGKVDSKRALGQHRVNIGNGGQNWINGAPCQLHGLNFEKELDKDHGDFDTSDVLQSIGRLVEFTWRVTCSLQDDTNDNQIAPDSFRKKLYAQKLNRYLDMDDEVGFEDLTLVVSSLLPVTHDVSEHNDTMNDTLAGYTRTACFNMVMIDENKDVPSILHFQVICNFRKVIGHYIVPFHGYLSNVAKHCRTYLDNWHRSMHLLYAGKTSTIPTAYDRSSFFLDDCLEYTTIAISEKGKHKQTLVAEYILTDINMSRTLSLSMFIDPLVKLQPYLMFDQTIELALVCSFLSNPFWFDWTMWDLIERVDDPDDVFIFQLHPFYDWAHTTIDTFGAWQGGPYNRWSPCGGSKESVLETFGAQPDASKEARVAGETKLVQVVSILRDHIEWINSMATCGNMPLTDMPLSTMKERCNQTINAIAKVASCQFSHFRLGILTTILSGCGLLKVGKHLRNCMYPVKGSASYKHLYNPIADHMSREKASALVDNNNNNESISNDGEGRVDEQHHDLFMQYLSTKLGFKYYVRDEIECILCESHPMRSLNCRDWFRKGRTIYDCNENGEYFSRAYGKSTKWERLCPPEEYDYAYLGTQSIQYIPIDGTLSFYSLNFAEDLRSTKGRMVKFKGRSSRTSSHQRSYSNTYQSNEAFPYPSMQMADFYVGTHVKSKPEMLQSMFVLGDAEHAVEMKHCNDLGKFPSGKQLHEYLQSLLIADDQASAVMAAGCYHMDSESSNNETTFFPGHLDKPFVHTVWFVPLGSTAFFTVISVRAKSMLVQDADSLRSFNEWMEKLSTGERLTVNAFLQDFDSQAKKHMRLESVKRLIYLNKLGSVLSFPANQCYHATITPKKPEGYPRDLFIFHPLDGNS